MRPSRYDDECPSLALMIVAVLWLYRMELLVAIAIAVVAFMLAGCRVYEYTTPEGATIKVTVFGADTKAGVIRAGKEDDDGGGRVYVEIENLSIEDRLTRVTEEALKRIPMVIP